MHTEKTRGIVLHSMKYSDTASIVTIYTQRFGRVAYMVYGVGKKKSVCRTALLQPLSSVELEVTHHPGKDIQHIKEMRAGEPFAEIPYHPVKSSIALFLAEVLFRALRRSEPDEELFAFLEHSILVLDCCGAGMADFHLLFLLKLTRYLGCEPNCEPGTEGYFDLMNGVFLKQRPGHTQYLPPDLAQDLPPLLAADYDRLGSLPPLSRKRRNELLECIVSYYRLHVPDFSGLNSPEVLQALFD